jgi:exonuclease III
VDVNGTRFINVYAPSGAEKKTERENFFKYSLTPLLPPTKTNILLAGDFNCIIQAADSTGHEQFSKGLATIIQSFDLHDVWNTSTTQPGYTHYAPLSASRLDRI